jgi:hypothetical protein
LSDFFVEIEENGSWTKLIKLNISSATAFSALPMSSGESIHDSLKRATKLDFDQTGLDRQFEKANAGIPGRGLIRGWVFFEYPSALTNVSEIKQVRISFMNVNGITEQHIVNLSDDRNPPLLETTIVPLATPFDISDIPLSHWPPPGPATWRNQ